MGRWVYGVTPPSISGQSLSGRLTPNVLQANIYNNVYNDKHHFHTHCSLNNGGAPGVGVTKANLVTEGP